MLAPGQGTLCPSPQGGEAWRVASGGLELWSRSPPRAGGERPRQTHRMSPWQGETAGQAAFLLFWEKVNLLFYKTKMSGLRGGGGGGCELRVEASADSGDFS